LRTQISSYLHDSSLSAELDTFIDLGAGQVNAILECEEMETVVSRVQGAPEQYISLPKGTRKLLSVGFNSTLGFTHLRSLPRHSTDYVPGAGPALFYRVEQKRVFPLPFNDTDYEALILQDVEIPADDQETVAALSAYPTLYLTAALAEAYDWKQNMEMGQRYTMKWRDLADSITTMYNSEIVGDTPAMRAM
jgi:hypothetical protein